VNIPSSKHPKTEKYNTQHDNKQTQQKVEVVDLANGQMLENVPETGIREPEP
jgi:hypothetical protein